SPKRRPPFVGLLTDGCETRSTSAVSVAPMTLNVPLRRLATLRRDAAPRRGWSSCLEHSAAKDRAGHAHAAGALLLLSSLVLIREAQHVERQTPLAIPELNQGSLATHVAIGAGPAGQ